VKISLSPNIDASGCSVCAKRGPWTTTLADIEAKLLGHGVAWADFRVIHGKDLTCAAASRASGVMDAGLYLVATDPHGVGARHVKVFSRVDGSYVGLSSVLNDTAFSARRRRSRE
jgi:hypothetical protein